MEDEDEIIKGFEMFNKEKLMLTLDNMIYFNTIINEAIGIIFQTKLESKQIFEILNKFRDYTEPFFEETNESELYSLIDNIKDEAEIRENPLSNLLYRKFCIILSVVKDIKDIPMIPKEDFIGINSGMKQNVFRICEVIEKFAEVWNPTMEKSEVIKSVEKIANNLNRKYDKKGYAIYS